MHSGHSGRGEDTPEVREGIVLPPQSEPWEAAPAGGQPWGQPQPQLQPQPQPQYSPFDGYGQQPAQPMPDGDATQLFPPYPQTPAPAQPPVAADATQMLPPYPQAMPSVADATQVLRPVPQAPATVPAAEPTEQLPRFDQYGGGYEAAQPAPPQDDFAHLYRQDGPQQPQPSQQPQFQQQPPPWQQQPAPPQQYGQQQYGQQAYAQQPYAQQPLAAPADAPGRKKPSPAVLVGIVVVACALAGLAAGAVMSGGGDDAQAAGSSASASASASSSTSAGSLSDGDSAAKGQAEKLDALLKESGSSRASVISAVSSIQSCQNLDQAASDLRAAATQRQGLVTQLGTLSVDQLPDHQALTEALTKAWNASASADTHYAAWADQAANQKKVCKGGHARTTGQTSAGNRDSGTASQAKKDAVKLWNTIAKKYGLTQRQYTQL
ncbi:hypothetical protein OG607_26000 [Streptomyces sp. NBC_01537]|uniref:hypothetical protein n=1 Tax=Streptomyces sp. NBC_01537 TaxID=2903896 RepID=UPI0038689FBC